MTPAAQAAASCAQWLDRHWPAVYRELGGLGEPEPWYWIVAERPDQNRIHCCVGGHLGAYARLLFGYWQFLDAAGRVAEKAGEAPQFAGFTTAGVDVRALSEAFADEIEQRRRADG